MASEKATKVWLTIGIGAGIIFLTAFLTSQVIFPFIFRAPKEIEVPNLIGQRFDNARRSLEDLGIHAVVKDSIWSETEKVGTILEQDPAPGELLRSEGTIYVRVSRGSQQVGIPSVVGQSYHEAYYTLLNVGLKGVVSDSLYSSSYTVNTVIRTRPETGSKVEKGSTVQLSISRGPEPVTEPVQEYSDPEDELAQ